jgi:hypothetical protein
LAQHSGRTNSTVPHGGANTAITQRQHTTTNGKEDSRAQDAAAADGSRQQIADAAFASLVPGWHFDPHLLWTRLDRLQEQVDGASVHRSTDAVVGATLSLLASAGFVVWRVFNSYVLVSAAAGSLLWKPGAREFDPLTILDTWERESREQQEKETLQALVA